MSFLKEIKIRIQQWRYIRTRNAQLRLLEKKKARAMEEADRLYQVDGKRRYVLFLVDRYVVLDNSMINEINRSLPSGARWDIVTVLNNCVYKTK
jgi:hypothetical protein